MPLVHPTYDVPRAAPTRGVDVSSQDTLAYGTAGVGGEMPVGATGPTGMTDRQV